MAKTRRLTWMQEKFIDVLKDGEWHDAPAVVSGSAIRGLMSRGMIERKANPNEHPWTWVREGKFRLKKDHSNATEG